MAAHRRYCDGKTLATGYDAFQDIIFFVKFIAREEYKIEDISDITATLLHRYREHLRSQDRFGDSASRRAWSIVVQFLRILSQHRSSVVTDMLILHEGLGSISARHGNLRKTDRVLTRGEVGTIIAACRGVISEYRSTWQEARAAMGLALDAGYSGHKEPNWKNYGEVLLWLE